MSTPKLTALQHLGYATETTWGEAVAPTRYFPFNEFSAEEELGTVVDEAKRGNITKDYGVIPTTYVTNIDMSSYFYPAVIGSLLATILPNVQTTGDGPYTHVFRASPAQRSLTFQFFNGADERQYAGVVIDEITISGETTSPIEVSVTGQGKGGKVVGTTTPAIEMGIMPITGAQASLKINGDQNVNLASFEITLTRENRMIYGASKTQDPTRAVQGRIEVTGSFSFEITDSTEYEMFKQQQYVDIELDIDGGEANKATFKFPRAFIESATWDDGEQSLRVDWEFRAVYDASVNGPVEITLVSNTQTY